MAGFKERQISEERATQSPAHHGRGMAQHIVPILGSTLGLKPESEVLMLPRQKEFLSNYLFINYKSS